MNEENVTGNTPGNLNNGGNGGVPCRNSGYGPSTANWNGSSGATGTIISI